MNEDLELLKQQLIAQNGKIDNIKASLTGISGDVKSLKDKITSLPGNADSAQIAELKALADSADSKLDDLVTSSAALDAETTQDTPPVE